jgi:hypothetical protein
MFLLRDVLIIQLSVNKFASEKDKRVKVKKKY